MKEIETLVQVFTPVGDVLKKLAEFEFLGDKHTIDTYYCDPMRSDLCPDCDGRLYACFRLREKDGVNYLTYKKDHFDGDTWLYSDEYETVVADANMAREIIAALGLKQLIVINNVKRTYRTDKYTIEFEDVAGLGLFIEVELCTNDDVDVAAIKQEIQDFIDNLGLSVSPELTAGKPELMLRKQGTIK